MWLRMFVFSMFQHTAARRRLAAGIHYCNGALQFQHTAARRRLGGVTVIGAEQLTFQHTAARRRLAITVPTVKAKNCFNTQPPEGGWLLHLPYSFGCQRFQHTAARRRLAINSQVRQVVSSVSTHSRPKAAGSAAGMLCPRTERFNTQPPEGGWPEIIARASDDRSFNTQPPEGGWVKRSLCQHDFTLFQYTAARRRLGVLQGDEFKSIAVSTHSRPKAAGVSV